ncbi:MAG: Acetophenone carboxylase gamma subunit [Alphaproteobacteria bacterium MarineAlpha3_Bin7]|nr:MAG: Acetophenone carboxylase gamma subunit [Alphaproteobacteria bacterium MarineAlpha3_Bin7]|tara:strand:+ start:2687 stop:4780 length:2094 start_codon:yes stop_codon:yes gene_type:complete
MANEFRLGVDIGGTFTDFSVVNNTTGSVTVEKMLTSSSRPEDAVLRGVELLAQKVPGLFEDLSEVIHATTLITNVILERKGSKTGLLTTAGFRDILEIGREVRYDIFDMFIRLPVPIVPRKSRLCVSERILADGSILEPLNVENVTEAANKFQAMKVEAVAVAFLHSYRNPSHEVEAANILRKLMPGVTLSLSHEVFPEPKEYERFSTTVIDAYVKSVADGYLEKLASGLSERGYKNELFVMLSNGGTSTVETAKSVPIQMVESGPAAGVEAACYFGRLMDIENLLSFDMGGTTAKLCIVEQGRAAKTRTFEVDRVQRFKAGSGLPVAVPVYDLLEIGAGGGSIARLDDLGLIKVGPDSAGSEPGPASYNRKGVMPTVTDADLILGYLNPDYFLGGQMPLDKVAAEGAITLNLIKDTGLTPIEIAAGIHEIVNENMASAARVYVAEKGKAPSNLSLIAFGGAGPVHAVGLAKKLGCPEVIVPPFSGVMSSLGLLTAPVAFERSKAVRKTLPSLELEIIEDYYKELEEEASSLMPDKSNLLIRRTADLRFSGQDYPLEIEVDKSLSESDVLEILEQRFINLYHELYGKVDDDNLVELASIRVYATQAIPELSVVGRTSAVDGQPKGSRDVYVSSMDGICNIPVYEREALRVGQKIMGPVVIEERESTTFIGLGDSVIVNEVGCLVVKIANSQISSKDG